MIVCFFSVFYGYWNLYGYGRTMIRGFTPPATVVLRHVGAQIVNEVVIRTSRPLEIRCDEHSMTSTDADHAVELLTFP